LLAQIAMELQVKDLALESSYFKGLNVLFGYQNFWVWWYSSNKRVGEFNPLSLKKASILLMPEA